MSAWSEPLRAAGDAVAFWACAPILSSAPRGDGHAVLVLPGFNSDDRSMAVMRKFLRYLAYRSEAWELGTTLALQCSARIRNCCATA